jgi:hypothetical protein
VPLPARSLPRQAGPVGELLLMVLFYLDIQGLDDAGD